MPEVDGLRGRWGGFPIDPNPTAPRIDPLNRDRLPKPFPELGSRAPGDLPFLQFKPEPIGRHLAIVALFAFLVPAVQPLAERALQGVPVVLVLIGALLLLLRTYVLDERPFFHSAIIVSGGVVFVALSYVPVAPVAGVPITWAALFFAGIFIDSAAHHIFKHMVSRSLMKAAAREAAHEGWKNRFRPHVLSESAQELADRARDDASFSKPAQIVGALTTYRRAFYLLPFCALFAGPSPASLLGFLLLPPIAACVLFLTGSSRGKGTLRDNLRRFPQFLRVWRTPYLASEQIHDDYKGDYGRSTQTNLQLSVVIVGLALTLAPYSVLTPPWSSNFTLMAIYCFLRGMLLPNLLLLSLVAAVLPPLAAAARASEKPSENPWEAAVETLELTDDPIDRRQLFLGYSARGDYPLLLPLPLLSMHAHVLGSTGLGKTSRTLLPLVAQLLRRETHPDESTEYRGPIVFIDMKATENQAFNTIKAACEETGRTFRYFTNRTGHTTHGYSPIDEFLAAGLTLEQRGETARAAFNVEYGSGYGPGHFSAISRRYLQLLLRQRPSARSFVDLMEAAEECGTGADRRVFLDLESHAGELRTAMEILSNKPELNVTPDWVEAAPTHEEIGGRRQVWDERISMQRAYANDEVLYFHLNAKFEEAASRHVASFVIENFYAACLVAQQVALKDAAEHPEEPHPRPKQSYVFIDEFQNVAGRNFNNFLEQARSVGVALILANQLHSQLKTSGGGLEEAIANVGWRQSYDFASEPAMAEAIGFSGTTSRYKNRELTDDGRILEGPAATSIKGDRSVEDHTRFTDNILLGTGAEHGYSVVRSKVNVDYLQFGGLPTVIYSPHHITHAAALSFKNRPWPALHDGTLLIDPDNYFAALDAGEPPPEPTAGPVSKRITSPLQNPDLAAAFDRISVVPAEGERVADRYDIDES